MNVIHCRDCTYFQLNVWSIVEGIPLIVAHEICRKWGDGCKTSPEGYCFMAKRKEEVNEQEDEEKDRLAAI